MDEIVKAGKPPYTSGIYPDMYRTRLWTMRQYAGFSTAKQTNERFRLLLEQGQTGLETALLHGLAECGPRETHVRQDPVAARLTRDNRWGRGVGG